MAGFAVWSLRASFWVWPAMVTLGAFEVALFTPLHETTHRTPFRSRQVNDAVGLLAGFVLLLPPVWFRHFHMAHHRHTQNRELDPELLGQTPLDSRNYVYRLSGIGYWTGNLRTLLSNALGRPSGTWLHREHHSAVTREARAFVLAYAMLACASIALRSTALLWLWLGPVLLAQPLLRWVLMAEHGGCVESDDGFSNTRTTLASWPLRLLFWNANFHAEHHIAPGVPFHALPGLHELIKDRLRCLDASYPAAHARIRAAWAGRKGH